MPNKTVWPDRCFQSFRDIMGCDRPVPKMANRSLDNQRGHFCRKSFELKAILRNGLSQFLSQFFGYDDCAHGLCNSHLLRELAFLFEVQQQDWAKNMIDCLLDIKKSVADAKGDRDNLPRKQRLEFEGQYQHILDDGFSANPPGPPTPNRRGRQKKSKARNMLERLDGHRQEVLAFMYDFNVPFDNNLAERDIRMAKVQQKISGAFRSDTGATAFCRIRSYISTVRKNTLNVLAAIENIFNAKRLPLPLDVV